MIPRQQPASGRGAGTEILDPDPVTFDCFNYHGNGLTVN
jgi:hypothetical protein